MSSTNRGTERHIDDVYETPAWCVHRLLDVWRPSGRSGILVEPAVGSGAIVRAIGTGPFSWLTYDIRDVAPCGEMHFTGDFLQVASFGTDAEAVVTNPPFSLAEEFIRHSRACFPGADLVFLLRLAFLASAKRLPLWRAVGTPDVYVLPNRPSFTGCGTDSADYAWFVWRRCSLGIHAFGKIQVLAETPASERHCR